MTFPYNNEEIIKCRSCREPIYFIKTASGKSMPVNFSEVEDERISHFATCPKAKAWRRLNKKKKKAPESINERFERLAEKFKRETGKYAPGKDVAPAVGGGNQGTLKEWQEWMKKQK